MEKLSDKIKNAVLYAKSVTFKEYLSSFVNLAKNPKKLRACISFCLNTQSYTPEIPAPVKGIVIKIPKYGVSLLSSGKSDIASIVTVFFSEIYKVSLKNDTIVIDIGYHIGSAALYFALNKNVEHIYSFEPFKENFAHAAYNLSLNPSLAKKITAYNYGLSDKDETFDISYTASASDYATTCKDLEKDVLKACNAVNPEVLKSKVVLKRADEEISRIINLHPNKKIILKANCEGAEYAIFDLLNQKGILKNIDIVMLEWHYKGPQKLLDILNANNFTSRCQNVFTFGGFIYAQKKEVQNA
ncbi:MAG: FkbM family methyltransferase [Elusimicrobia bacterium]|nr:FkbM family methyltransferase [Elusimicrobiota bacterium]